MFRELHRFVQRACKLDRHAHDIMYRLVINADIQCCRPQPRAIALRTCRVTAIACKQHAIMKLVSLFFDLPEESVDPDEIPVAFLDDLPLAIGECSPWLIHV